MVVVQVSPSGTFAAVQEEGIGATSTVWKDRWLGDCHLV